MTVNPSSDFIRHTTDLCWLPAPHSAEHWLTYNNSIDHMDLIRHWKIERREKNILWHVTVKPQVFSYSRQLPLKPSVTFCRPHTWLQGPVNHSMRFSQGPLLQTWESAGRSLPHPSRGRLPMWLVRQRIPLVRTPIPHSAEHCRVNTHFTHFKHPNIHYLLYLPILRDKNIAFPLLSLPNDHLTVHIRVIILLARLWPTSCLW